MAFFQSFTDSIKQKWLQFFQENRDWLRLHMEVESVYTHDGGKRPPSYLILGVVIALEPKLAQLMLPFSRLNPDADTLVEVLELNFDPDIALGNRIIPKQQIENDSEKSVSVTDDVLENETFSDSQFNNFGEENSGQELQMENFHEQTLMVPETEVKNELKGMSEEHNGHNGWGENSLSLGEHSNNQSHETPNVDAVEAFGDISFDELKEDDSNNSAAMTSEENGFNQVISDVWGDETLAHKGEEDNELFLGEELPSENFDDTEISHLFPNK
jgi:hypothetical protein